MRSVALYEHGGAADSALVHSDDWHYRSAQRLASVSTLSHVSAPVSAAAMASVAALYIRHIFIPPSD
jgi:hypothetical protein